MIDINKRYRTRDGREVRIYAVDGEGEFCVHGAILDRHGWSLRQWPANGFPSSPGSPVDLIEVRSRIKRKIWVNVYPDCMGMGMVCHSKEEADNAARSGLRIACVEIDIDVEEGHGL